MALPQGPGDSRPEHWFRQLTPLVLLATGFVVLFEPWCRGFLPGSSWFSQQLGETWLLRLCIALLVFYVLLLWGESIRLHHGLTSLLKAFRDALQKGGAGGADPKVRLDALRVLIAALRSDDPKVRATSHQNLVRMAGHDLGQDPAAWQRWLATQADVAPPAAPGPG